MSKTGFVYHEDFLLHNTGAWHPERADRLESITENLTSTGLIEKLKNLTPEPAKIKWIETIHTPEYIKSVENVCKLGYTNLDADTTICVESFRIALLAVGSGILASDKIMNGCIHNAFCAVRPPGHHAEKKRAMGFCLFNNVAITARYLQQKYSLNKILIIDWDVHHGNGTQNAFYDDPTVFYFSVHQSPHYPGTGLISETGIGKGEGFNLNVPLPAGLGDKEYIEIFQSKLLPAAQKFKPDFVLVSAGFDAHRDDPLSGMQLTETGYAKLTDIVVSLADEFCQGKLISLLEGGYNLEKLASSVAAHIDVLLRRRSHEKDS
jgi:acetoin utilization deacetylase AcuC-like enzyme